ncbi:hypothetical protein BJV74DRAFT_867990 [Russula compacta]|nr:hypothetical protein BJV74DRAFT_867990 [Russula compacta]
MSRDTGVPMGGKEMNGTHDQGERARLGFPATMGNNAPFGGHARGEMMRRDGAQRVRSCSLRGRIEVIRRRGRKRKTPGPGALVQRDVNGASEGKDAHRVRPHHRIPSQVARRGHQLVPKLAKLAPHLVAGVLHLELAHRAEPRARCARVGRGGMATSSVRVE